MSDFQKVASVDDVKDGELTLVEVDERLVILVRCGEDIVCIDDVCTHDGGTLSNGEIKNCRVRCPRHGAEFDARTGAALTMPATEPTVCHEVKVDGGSVYVKINEQ